MRTLIRKAASGLYLKAGNRWTRNASGGMAFESIDDALDFIRKHGLEDVEFAFSFGNGAEIVTVPLARLELDFVKSE